MAYNPHRRQADPLGRPWPTPRSPPAGPGGRTGRTVHAHPGGLKPGPSLPLAPGSPRGLSRRARLGRMPKTRWVEWEGHQWRLSHLAVVYHLKPQTLAHRLDRGLPIERALATGICTRDAAGRRGRDTSPWGEWVDRTATG